MSQSKLEEFVELYRENGNSFHFKKDGYSIIEKGEWEQDCKQQYRSSVVCLDGDYFDIAEGRSGSPFTDWEYFDATITPVNRQKKVVEIDEWVPTGTSIEIPND